MRQCIEVFCRCDVQVVNLEELPESVLEYVHTSVLFVEVASVLQNVCIRSIVRVVGLIIDNLLLPELYPHFFLVW